MIRRVGAGRADADAGAVPAATISATTATMPSANRDRGEVNEDRMTLSTMWPKTLQPEESGMPLLVTITGPLAAGGLISGHVGEGTQSADG